VLGNPMVSVTCDYCGDEDSLPLTPLAGGCYDERNIKGDLETRGWISGEVNTHYCTAECADEAGR